MIAMTSGVIDRIPGSRIDGGSFNKQEVAMTALPQISNSVSTPAGPAREMSLVRAALLIDAVASGLTAALLIAGADLLRDWLGLPVVLMREAGLILAVYVALVAVAATRPQVSRRAVWAVIVTNVVWALASFAILETGLIAPTTLGVAFVAGQALAVLALGALQYAALRRS
jgi:hypothetical protein